MASTTETVAAIVSDGRRDKNKTQMSKRLVGDSTAKAANAGNGIETAWRQDGERVEAVNNGKSAKREAAETDGATLFQAVGGVPS